MRVSFFFGGMFWGILLILWGASLILKTFGLNLPLAKLFIAVAIILFGIKLLVGSRINIFNSGSTKARTASYYRSNSTGEYTFVFSGGTVDLTDLDPNSKDLEITVVFGNADVLLPRHLNFDFEPTTVFGQTILPAKGEMKAGDNPAIRIESTAVFGKIQYLFSNAMSEADAEVTTEQNQDF